MSSFKEVSEKKLQRLDERALRIANGLIDDDIARGTKLELLLKLKADKEEKKGYLTEKQRMLIRSIHSDYDDYEYNHDLCTRLSSYLTDGKLPRTAENFVRSVVQFFNDTHELTALQREQMIRIALACDGETKPPAEKEDLDEDGYM